MIDMAEGGADRRITSANVMFCLDTTGSMTFAINAVKEAIARVTEIYVSARIDIRVGLIEFRDRIHAYEHGNPDFDGYHETLRMIDFEGQGNFTDNPERFRGEVSELIADGGGPTPESSFDAMAHAARESSWTEGSTKVIILITDAPPRIPDYEISNIDELVEVMSSSAIDQIFIVTPMNYHEAWDEMARVEVRSGEWAFVSWHELEANPTTERLVEELEIIAQTSSDSISESENNETEEDDDGSESENPFERDDGGSESENPFERDDDVAPEGEDEDATYSDSETPIRDSAEYSDSDGSDSDGLFDD